MHAYVRALLHRTLSKSTVALYLPYISHVIALLHRTLSKSTVAL